jgi:hypothetical protein
LDPVLASTDQPYAYANDNPVNASDPSGLCTTDKYTLVSLEGPGNCDHYINAQLAQLSGTAQLIEQGTATMDMGLNQVLDDLGAGSDQAAI